jgi:hypothetical protein
MAAKNYYGRDKLLWQRQTIIYGTKGINKFNLFYYYEN